MEGIMALPISIMFPIPSRDLEQIDLGSDLYIYHHLGLGDMIHLNGMVRYLLSKMEAGRQVHVFCKERNMAMTRWMYRDEERVLLESIPTGMREGPEVQRVLRENRTKNFLSVGHRALRAFEQRYPARFFDELFYMQVGLPYRIRYSHCHWERDYEQEERVFAKLAPRGAYAFVHDDPERGYSIDSESIGLPIVRNDVTESIFHLGLLLERAREVHCMESSIRCMIESLSMRGVELYYHNFRYPERPLGEATQLAWKQIDYPRGKSRAA
jgi:hypothetical protein